MDFQKADEKIKLGEEQWANLGPNMCGIWLGVHIFPMKNDHLSAESVFPHFEKRTSESTSESTSMAAMATMAASLGAPLEDVGSDTTRQSAAEIRGGPTPRIQVAG